MTHTWNNAHAHNMYTHDHQIHTCTASSLADLPCGSHLFTSSEKSELHSVYFLWDHWWVDKSRTYSDLQYLCCTLPPSQYLKKNKYWARHLVYTVVEFVSKEDMTLTCSFQVTEETRPHAPALLVALRSPQYPEGSPHHLFFLSLRKIMEKRFFKKWKKKKKQFRAAFPNFPPCQTWGISQALSTPWWVCWI